VLSTVTNSGPCPLIVTRTWTATDPCGNIATCSQTVTVVDTNRPSITICPTNIVVCSSNGCGPMPNVTNLVQATDGSGVHISQSIAPGTILCTNSIVTFTVTDDCGNETSLRRACDSWFNGSVDYELRSASDGFHILFATQSGFIYVVEYTDTLVPATWVPFPSVTGDGAIHELVDPKPLAKAGSSECIDFVRSCSPYLSSITDASFAETVLASTTSALNCHWL